MNYQELRGIPQIYSYTLLSISSNRWELHRNSLKTLLSLATIYYQHLQQFIWIKQHTHTHTHTHTYKHTRATNYYHELLRITMPPKNWLLWISEKQMYKWAKIHIRTHTHITRNSKNDCEFSVRPTMQYYELFKMYWI